MSRPWNIKKAWRLFGLKEIKKKWQLNSMCHLALNPGPETILLLLLHKTIVRKLIKSDCIQWNFIHVNLGNTQ